MKKPLAHNTAEIEKFNALAADWWNPSGPMAPLHWMNPARLDFIKAHMPPKAKSGLDIGCGAGLLTEPLARLGYSMTGMDGAADAVAVAKKRAEEESLKINYHVGEIGPLRIEDREWKIENRAPSSILHPPSSGYDFVTALEIIEHVDDAGEFLDAALAQLKSGGVIFLSTLNRTIKARALGIIAAEYILRALPVGTHDYNKFTKPSELVGMLEARGCRVTALSGLVFKPLQKTFVLDDADLDMNYILAAVKK